MTKNLRLIIAMILALIGVTAVSAPVAAAEPSPSAISVQIQEPAALPAPEAIQVHPSVILCGVSYYDYKVVTAYKTKYFWFYWEAQAYRESLWDPWKMYKFGQFDSNDYDCGEWKVVAYRN